MNEMRDLLHKVFTCWDLYMSPRPLALARMKYLGKSRKNPQELTNLKSYRGPTTDRLHFSGATSRYFWKLVYIHVQLLSKMPGKSYDWLQPSQSVIRSNQARQQKRIQMGRKGEIQRNGNLGTERKSKKHQQWREVRTEYQKTTKRIIRRH